MNFEINVNFLINPFSYVTKKTGPRFKNLKNEKTKFKNYLFQKTIENPVKYLRLNVSRKYLTPEDLKQSVLRK